MISRRHRCIFVHIPRTGGTSIEHMLWPEPRSEADLWWGYISRYRNRHQTGALQHLFARHIRQEVGQQTFSAYFKFAMVRNPWEKALSQYLYLQRRKDLLEFLGLRRGDPFPRYLERIQQRVHVQWEPQYKFLLDDDDTLLVDFVGRFEHYDRDVTAILRHLSAEATIPHLKATSHAHYSRYYDPGSIEVVGNLYRRDIDQFGYAFEREHHDAREAVGDDQHGGGISWRSAHGKSRRGITTLVYALRVIAQKHRVANKDSTHGAP
jgi:hypothetical protein